MKYTDLAVVADRVGEMLPVRDGFAVDEHNHVMSQRPVLVENVGPGTPVGSENRVKHFADVCTRGVAGGTGDVTLDVLGERYASDRLSPLRFGEAASTNFGA